MISFSRHSKSASTYAEVGRTTVGVFVVCSQAIDVFHRPTIIAVEIYWVAILPVVPDLINHLSLRHSNLSALSVNQCNSGHLRHGARRKLDLYSVSTSAGEKVLEYNK